LYRARKLKLKSAPIETKVISPDLRCQYTGNDLTLYVKDWGELDQGEFDYILGIAGF
jgi:hypothetical protein